MKLTHETYDRISVIGVSGDLTVDDMERFRQLIEEQLSGEARDFVFDLSSADFLDSAALEALLWVQDQADERLGQVRLASATENVQRILHITRLDKHFDAHEDVDGALKSLR